VVRVDGVHHGEQHGEREERYAEAAERAPPA
jgi:hypothetical protein